MQRAAPFANGAFVLARKHLSAMERNRRPSGLNQFSADRVGDGFEPGMRAQLLIDVVQVVSQRLRTNLEVGDDAGGTLSLRKTAEHPTRRYVAPSQRSTRFRRRRRKAHTVKSRRKGGTGRIENCREDMTRVIGENGSIRAPR
jgi:hypothetical protein